MKAEDIWKFISKTLQNGDYCTEMVNIGAGPIIISDEYPNDNFYIFAFKVDNDIIKFKIGKRYSFVESKFEYNYEIAGYDLNGVSQVFLGTRSEIQEKAIKHLSKYLVPFMRESKLEGLGI